MDHFFTSIFSKDICSLIPRIMFIVQRIDRENSLLIYVIVV